MTKLRWLGLVALALLLAGAMSYQWLERQWSASLPVDEPQLITVAKGEYADAILGRLKNKQWLPRPWMAKIWLRLNPKQAQIKAGTYEVTPGMSLKDLFVRLAAGDEKQFAITLVEGLQWRQWRESLLADSRLNSQGFNEQQLIAQLSLQGDSLEGQLMPDTYHFTHGTSVTDLVLRAYERMQAYLNTQWQQRQVGLPLESPYQALILASIVEKETALAEERPLIAGVFINRLRRNMRLQTDPTVIYGMGEAFDGNIRRADLRRKTPYNTYVIKGLPPTPIAMVGREAVDASLHPADTQALYFVSRNDGSHVFSTTLADHNAAVRKYQLNQE
ncbi:UPF0755 protein [Saliniradius amylolyticus]|uniref:Endolytic murein transglycosylase n=1 Tax=Saliniradius amylolyticus TaxID=2183582 RepID=A0A2S2E451_9ALTE|nr:endolytic transglycosylase MltG [Saliniradius amylolyticus]AWL12020.1 UPF0755 protein [Saliniradius amylolyticus]